MITPLARLAAPIASSLVLGVSVWSCSMMVADLDEFDESPTACLQQPTLRSSTRDMRLRLDMMQAHGSQAFYARVISPNGAIAGSAVLMPTSAGVTGPSRMALVDSGAVDGLQCELDSFEDLDVDFTVPDMIPPGASYALDFWADLNRNGHRDPHPSDHDWYMPVCDDGSMRFIHNFDFVTYPEAVQETGALTVRLTPSAFVSEVAAASGLGEGSAARLALEARLRSLPLTILVRVQSHVIGYLRTQLDCVVDQESDFDFTIPSVIDGGNRHAVELYLDTQRDGAFDERCDPVVRLSRDTSDNRDVTIDLGTERTEIVFPDAFASSDCVTP